MYNVTPYSQREEWKDISPVEQDDGPAPAAAIMYEPVFIEVMNYFRAVMQKREISERALGVTKDVILMNPSNYTVWPYRLELVDKLEVDLDEEKKFLDPLITETQKCYQYWNYRGKILERSKRVDEELEFINEAIDLDSKNYHAFCHRQWIIKTFDKWEKEAEWTEELIREDVWNNSVWNHRYMVMKHAGFTIETLRSETEFTTDKIKLAPSNESPWLYLKGLLRASPADHVETLQNVAKELQQKYPYSTMPEVFLADIYSWTGEREKECELIEGKLLNSPLQRAYWKYRLASLKT